MFIKVLQGRHEQKQKLSGQRNDEKCFYLDVKFLYESYLEMYPKSTSSFAFSLPFVRKDSKSLGVL